MKDDWHSCPMAFLLKLNLNETNFFTGYEAGKNNCLMYDYSFHYLANENKKIWHAVYNKCISIASVCFEEEKKKQSYCFCCFEGACYYILI